jgi:hypothetical protein
MQALIAKKPQLFLWVKLWALWIACGQFEKGLNCPQLANANPDRMGLVAVCGQCGQSNLRYLIDITYLYILLGECYKPAIK